MIDINNYKTTPHFSEITSKFYLKVRVRGVEDYSDIYNKTEDSFTELPCDTFEEANALAQEIMDTIYDTIGDAGNEVVAYKVSLRR